MWAWQVQPARWGCSSQFCNSGLHVVHRLPSQQHHQKKPKKKNQKKPKKTNPFRPAVPSRLARIPSPPRRPSEPTILSAQTVCLGTLPALISPVWLATVLSKVDKNRSLYNCRIALQPRVVDPLRELPEDPWTPFLGCSQSEHWPGLHTARRNTTSFAAQVSSINSHERSIYLVCRCGCSAAATRSTKQTSSDPWASLKISGIRAFVPLAPKRCLACRRSCSLADEKHPLPVGAEGQVATAQASPQETRAKRHE